MEGDDKRKLVGSLMLRLDSSKIASQLGQKGYKFKDKESEEMCQKISDSVNTLFCHGLIDAKTMSSVRSKLFSIINSQVEKDNKLYQCVPNVVVIDHDEEV